MKVVAVAIALAAIACGGATSSPPADAGDVDGELAPDAGVDGDVAGDVDAELAPAWSCFALGTPGPVSCEAAAVVDCSGCPDSCVAFDASGVCQ